MNTKSETVTDDDPLRRAILGLDFRTDELSLALNILRYLTNRASKENPEGETYTLLCATTRLLEK